MDEERYDVLVAGAGPVGLTAAIAIARQGFRTCVVGTIDQRDTGRTVALMEGSLRLFQALDLRERIEAASAPLAAIRIVDVTDSIFRSRAVEFRADEIGLSAFGRNIENGRMVALLHESAMSTPGLTIRNGLIASYSFGPERVAAQVAAGGPALAAALLVGADGLNSPARTAADIQTRRWTYDQTALTAIFAHAASHHGVSTEFHTRGGPFTLVPLPGSEKEPHRSSLVWMMKPREARRRLKLSAEEFSLEAERQAQSLLGAMRLVGPVGAASMQGLRAASMTARRLALAGEAAHAFPPIGAQGLNLGLRDVAALVRAIAGRTDPGEKPTLEAYRRSRRSDVALRACAVDLVNRSLPSGSLAADFVRGVGLQTIGAVGPLRRVVIRLGLGSLGASVGITDRRRAIAAPGPLDGFDRVRP